MEFTQWRAMRDGLRCPFDGPRAASNEEWDIVGSLSVSSLYLGVNQCYRGHCLLILDRRHATRPDELPKNEWLQFCEDLHTAESAIVGTLNPDHINLATLGNVVPHLHWHIIPRYRDDPRWGAPIWLTEVDEMPVVRMAPIERSRLLKALRDAIGQ